MDNAMVFQYITETGEIIEFISEQIKHLSFSDLLKTKGNNNAYFELEISTSHIDLTQIDGETKGAAKILQNITFHQKPKIFSLVDGGWLPPAFVTPQNLLVDRNVISALSQISSGSNRLDLKSSNWWLTFPASVGMVIHPLLYAIEGNKQRTPTFEEFCESFVEASHIISRQLKSAQLVTFNDLQYQAAYDIIAERLDRHKKEIEFVQRVAPIIKNRPSDKDINKKRDDVLKCGDSLGIGKKSLIFVAAMSCLYENRDGSGFLAAREVLKPGKIKSAREAFNVVSDLQALEIYIGTLSLSSPRFYFCTSDLGIAGLWSGLRPKNTRWENGTLCFDLSIDEALFPRFYETDKSNPCSLFE